MPRRKSKKDKRVVEQYEYVKVGKSKTKTKRTKKPKGSGDVVQTVIVQAPGRRRRAAKPKAEVWQPMAAPLVQQFVQPTQVPYQFRSEPAAPIMPVATPPKVEQPLITFEAPTAFQPAKSVDFGELADIFRAPSLPKTKEVGTEPDISFAPPVISFTPTIVQDAQTQTRKPKAKEIETQTDIPEQFNVPEPADFGVSFVDTLESRPISTSQPEPTLLSLTMPEETPRVPDVGSPPYEAPELEVEPSPRTPPPIRRPPRPSYMRRQRPTISQVVEQVMRVEGMNRTQAAQLVAEKRDIYKGQYAPSLTTNTKNEKSLLDVAKDYGIY